MNIKIHRGLDQIGGCITEKKNPIIYFNAPITQK